MNKSGRAVLPADETALFCEQIAMVLSAGIPVTDGVDTLAETYADSRFGARFAEIRDAVIEHGTLSDALAESGLFPRYLIGMARIGERAGKLDEVMRALANYYQWEADVKLSMRNAILYPAVLVIMLAAVVGVLIVSVMPVFRRVFESLGLSAGAPTGAAMRIGTVVGECMLVLIVLLLVLLACVFFALRSKKRESVLELLGRILPPVRRVSDKLATGRFCYVLSILLSAGESYECAMEFMPMVITDARALKRIQTLTEKLQAGASFADAVEESKLFDPMHEKMIRFGTAAGRLDSVMEKLRDIYMNDADDAIHYLVSMIEPALVIILSVVIGGVLLSVMLPLTSILSSLGA